MVHSLTLTKHQHVLLQLKANCYGNLRICTQKNIRESTKMFLIDMIDSLMFRRLD